MKQADNPFAIRQLYQRRFYQPSEAKGVIQKVLAFQKKIQEPRVYRKPLYQSIHQNTLLQQQSFRFRPSTNYMSHRAKRDVNSSLQGQTLQGLATELAIQLQTKNASKRASSRSQTRRVIQTPEENTQRFSKMDFATYLEDRKVYTSSRTRQRQNGSTSNRKISMTVTSNHQTSKVLSKKVFIGGRDLEKAAEQYRHHYTALKKHQDQYEKKNYLGRRKSLSSRKAHLLAKKSESSKKQQLKKQEDLMFKTDFAPWNVEIQQF